MWRMYRLRLAMVKHSHDPMREFLAAYIHLKSTVYLTLEADTEDLGHVSMGSRCINVVLAMFVRRICLVR